MINWLKTIWKRFWKWLTILIVGGVAVANIVGFPPPEEVLTNFQLAEQCIATPKKIDECAGNLSSKEKAKIKGQKIAELASIPKILKGDYQIEVVSLKSIENGVEVLVRAWDKNGNQIGFGKDGTVDIERFVIINPPILVEDLNGDIIREWIDKNTGQLKQRKLREDPKEALLQTLIHTISVKKEKFDGSKIIKGKTGNTTTTVYPDANPESTSMDGQIQENTSNIWSTIRSEAAGDVADDLSASENFFAILWNDGSNLWDTMVRSAFLFDTSSIPDTDTIDSATISFWNLTIVDNFNQGFDLVASTPASNTGIVVGDYDQFGTTLFANSVDLTGITTGQYTDMALITAGLNAIDKTGITKFGTRISGDRSNTEPADPGATLVARANGYYADQTGTTNDPKLVVEHSGGAAADEIMIIDEED